MSAKASDATMAVFLDLENIALGARDAKYPSFDIEKVLERLLLKGHIVVKKAYCDFERYKDFKRGLHEAAFELIEIPHVRQSGKNSADIVPREIVVQYVVGAYMAVLTWWLDDGAKLPPKRIDAMFRRLATEGITPLN